MLRKILRAAAEKTLKASGIFKKRYRLFNRTKYYSRVIHGPFTDIRVASQT